MADIGSACVDLFEAPNVAGSSPFVMFTYDESVSWCLARGKRLCFEDEWLLACGGSIETQYPYGNAHIPGMCNDDKTWRVYSQTKLNSWPYGLATDGVNTLDELYDLAERTVDGAIAAEHVAELYQADPSGSNAECRNTFGVYDLVGNVEEWTTRRDGEPNFHGNLKGRYWAEPRTCQSNLTSHGDGFRFYEIGFRCCMDRP